MPGGVPLPGWGGVSSDRLGYDGAGRMITKRYLTGGINETTKAYNNTTSLVGATTSFDRAGNKFFERHLEAEDRSHLYQPFNSDGSFGVGYDSANRLLQYQRGVLNGDVTPYLVPAGASIDIPTTLPGADQVRTYGLDGLGNWKTTNFTEVGSGGSTTSTAETRAHNYVNEITSTRDGTSSATPFTYDKNGNLLNDGIRSYKYDALNRLVQVKKVSGGALIGAYVYDGLNRRIQKTISNGGLTGGISNGTTNYLYDDQQIVTERDEDGNWLKANFWGQYIDELLFFAVPTETVPTTYRVLSDLLYRSTAIVTTSNVITEAYDCDAYGNTLCYSGPGTDGLWFTDDDVQTNNPINTTIFTGRQYDPESQIYYYRARYYSPSIGRFISRDPLGAFAGLNLLAYVRNNPTSRVDPLGLIHCCFDEDDACIDAIGNLINATQVLSSAQKIYSNLVSQTAQLQANLIMYGEEVSMLHITIGILEAAITAYLGLEVLTFITLANDIYELQEVEDQITAAQQTLSSLHRSEADYTQIIAQDQATLNTAQTNANTAFNALITCANQHGENIEATDCYAFMTDAGVGIQSSK